MAQKLIQAIFSGPKNKENALKVVKITSCFLLVSAIITAGLAVAGFYWSSDNEVIEFFLDPSGLIDVGIILFLAYFVYKLKLWAAIVLIVYQLLSSLVVYLEMGHIPSGMVILKLALFISTAKGIWLVNKLNSENN